MGRLRDNQGPMMQYQNNHVVNNGIDSKGASAANNANWGTEGGSTNKISGLETNYTEKKK